MIRINLLPPEIAQEKAKRRQVEIVVASVILIVILLVGAYVVKTAQLMAIKSELGEIESELAKQAVIVSQVEALKASKEVLNTRVSIIDRLVKGQFIWVQLLDEINYCLPKNVWLGSITSSQAGTVGAVTFSGIAFDNFAIADFITSLEDSKYFGDVELTYIQEGSEIDKVMTLNFVVVCKVQI
ncbi:MAG: PilN domain-containing protein [bacterium]